MGVSVSCRVERAKHVEAAGGTSNEAGANGHPPGCAPDSKAMESAWVRNRRQLLACP